MSYLVSSLLVADTARLPQFTSDLAAPFYIGVRSSSGQPLLISMPHASEGEIAVAFRWCTTNGDFPSDPSASKLTAISSAVSLSGYSSADGEPISFEDQGSWIYTSASRT